MYAMIYVGVNRGLKEYTAFVDSKEAAGFQEMREVTQKPRMAQPPFPMLEQKSSFKVETNKNIPGLMMNVQIEAPEEMVEESAMLAEEEDE